MVNQVSSLNAFLPKLLDKETRNNVEEYQKDNTEVAGKSVLICVGQLLGHGLKW